MTTRDKMRAAELESRMKMWGIAPAVESIHDDENQYVRNPYELDDMMTLAEWRDRANQSPVLLSRGKPVAVKPYFSIVNMLTVACAVMVVAALVSLIVFGRVQP